MQRACIDFPAIDGVAVCFSEDPASGLIRHVEFIITGFNDDQCTACKHEQGTDTTCGSDNIDVLERVRAFLEGRESLDRKALLQRCVLPTSKPGSFRDLATRALLSLPSGETTTYGKLAALAGNPRAARAAGITMRGNSLPIIVPCHKVVAASGLGGFAGNRHPALAAVKRRLLDLDGCVVP